MTSYSRGELRKFLRSLDRHLKKPFRLVIIGGAAASLAFDARKVTVDIDTANKVGAIQGACEAARKETGLEIPLGFATAYEAPRRFQERVKTVRLPGLRYLLLFVPDKHDWALMKMARLLEKDLADIQAAARICGFSRSVLLERFRDEMIGSGQPADKLTLHFLAMIEVLWGSSEASRMERALKGAALTAGAGATRSARRR